MKDFIAGLWQLAVVIVGAALLLVCYGPRWVVRFIKESGAECHAERSEARERERKIKSTEKGS